MKSYLFFLFSLISLIVSKRSKQKSNTLWSQPFTINTHQCKWKYKVINIDHEKEQLHLISQILIDEKTGKELLNLDLTQFLFDFNPIAIDVLDENNFSKKNIGESVITPAPYSYTNENIDINKDSYHDFQFITEHAAAGANIKYATYLYNAKERCFEYSKTFSGYNVNFNKGKNRVSTFSKSGVSNYYYTFKNLHPNRQNITFIEKVHQHKDTVAYQKLVNNKVIEQKELILEDGEDWISILERN